MSYKFHDEIHEREKGCVWVGGQGRGDENEAWWREDVFSSFYQSFIASKY